MSAASAHARHADHAERRELSAADRRTWPALVLLGLPLLTATACGTANDLADRGFLGSGERELGDSPACPKTTPQDLPGRQYDIDSPVWTELQQLVASDAAPDDSFGFAVGLWQDTAMIGAPRRDGPAGGQLSAGAAYVFAREPALGSPWQEVTTLVAGEPQKAGTYFGSAVALREGIAVVGAPHEHQAGTANQGAAYVFRQQGGPGEWSQVSRLTASDATDGACFGWSVALGDGIAVVGAPAPQPYAAADQQGAAYVFLEAPSGWSEVAKLSGFPDDDGDQFGWAVGISGDSIIVGAPGEQGGRGVTRIFRLDSGQPESWVVEAALEPWESECTDDCRFGAAVALMSDQALVGSPNQGDPGMVHRGAAYRFNRGPDDGNPWDDWQKLVHPAATGEDYLGISVALAADLGVVGTSPTAFIGKAGAAYLFHPDPNSQGTWIADEQPLPASNVDKLDRFGQSVAVWQNAAQGALGTTIFVGAPWQHRSGESLLGAVYAFAERRDLGDPCETPAQCQSGQCVTGTCCNSACASGRCPDGQCVVLAANGTSCTSGDECQSGFCTDGVCCTQASCLPFRCTEEGACPFACQSGHDCAPGYQCSSTHECKPTAAEADDTGCACGLTGAPRRPWGPSALALAAALFGRRRRRPSSPRRTRVSS